MCITNRKKHDRATTGALVLQPNRPEYGGGENWLGHGGNGGQNARIDALLLDGATKAQLLKLRNTWNAVMGHLQHLRMVHDLPYERIGDKYRFDRAHLGITTSQVSDRTFVEGEPQTSTGTVYERDPAARQACIEHYGMTCTVCNSSMERIYGAIANGCIHVHHLHPLAAMHQAYACDPVRDLRPVCPNCHAIIHRREPCYTIKEVQASLQKQRTRSNH